MSLTGTVMAVDIETEGELVMGAPREVLAAGVGFDAARDGRIVLVKRIATEGTEHKVVLVQYWFEELKRLVPTDN